MSTKEEAWGPSSGTPGLTWEAYRRNHPEVVASWGQQNGRKPNCTCERCELSARFTLQGETHLAAIEELADLL